MGKKGKVFSAGVIGSVTYQAYWNRHLSLGLGKTDKGKMAPRLLTDSGGRRLVRQGECRRGARRGAAKPPFCFCVAGLWLYYINLGAVRYILITVKLAARSKGVKSALRHC